MLRWPLLIVLFLILNAWFGMSFLSCAGVVMWAWYVLELFEVANERIAFKEFILVLYGLNYLFSPAISYLVHDTGFYRMKLPEEEYFSLAIPAILFLQVGMNCVKTSVFQFRFRTIQLQSLLNQELLVQWLYAGIVIVFLGRFIPSDLGFFFYLLSGIRFVAAYGLYIMNAQKYKWHLIGVTLIELFMALQQGMFHDLIMWVIFFGILWTYLHKPTRTLKLLIATGAFLALYILQLTKAEYREQIGSNNGEAGLATFQNAVERKLDDGTGLFNSEKTTGSLTRVNQAWIFASTVNRMNYIQDYQGMDLLSKYAEAAFLPRYFAPNKLKAGDRAIFNKYSGHQVSAGTSMGLGFFADGCIAYGHMGVYVFAFALGLIFSLIFKLVEKWSTISPFFVLLMFPILTYAVRPDCETQTLMGHIVKGVFVYGCLMWYYSVQFSRKTSEINIEKTRLSIWKERVQNKRFQQL